MTGNLVIRGVIVSLLIFFAPAPRLCALEPIAIASNGKSFVGANSKW